MNNNPFLKPKESSKLLNNRFASLQDDDTSSFKETSNKKNKYNSSQNSFSKFSNFYKQNKQNKHNTQTKNDTPLTDLTSNNLNIFPELVKINKNTNSILETTNNTISFKNILNNVDESVEKETKNTVPKGWAKISFNNRKKIITYGPSTSSFQHHKKEELITNQQSDEEQDLNHIMFNAIEDMKKSWDKYKQEYDDLHGEGAYVEKFSSSPVYNSDYNSEDENDNFENTDFEYDEDDNVN